VWLNTNWGSLEGDGQQHLHQKQAADHPHPSPERAHHRSPGHTHTPALSLPRSSVSPQWNVASPTVQYRPKQPSKVELHRMWPKLHRRAAVKKDMAAEANAPQEVGTNS
jgi:hypothetical protein